MLIMITGLPGSGKTTVAKYIQEYFNSINQLYFYYNTDSLRNLLFTIQNTEDRDFTEEELTLTYKVLSSIVSEVLNLKEKRVVIVDGFFRSRSQRLLLKDIAKTSHENTLHIHVESKDGNIIKRLEKRYREGRGSGTKSFKVSRVKVESLEDEERKVISNNGNLAELEKEVLNLMDEVKFE